MMGFEAYLHDDAGTTIVPADWRDWVSASRTRNWCRKDPLLDWLHLYGTEKGYEQDAEPDPRTDFQAFVFRKGREFEAAAVSHLATLDHVRPIASGVDTGRGFRWPRQDASCCVNVEAWFVAVLGRTALARMRPHTGGRLTTRSHHERLCARHRGPRCQE